jgi:hypothetical protein
MQVNGIPDNKSKVPDERFESILYDHLRETDDKFLHYVVCYNRCENNTNESSFTAIRIPNIIIEKLVELGISRAQFGINPDETIIDIKVLNTRPDAPYVYQMCSNPDRLSEPNTMQVESPVMRFTKSTSPPSPRPPSPPPPPPSPPTPPLSP